MRRKLKKIPFAAKSFLKAFLAPVLFQEKYYVETSLKGKKPILGAWLHFILVGSWRGRDPHPCFDGDYYAKNVGRKLLNPYLHYVLVGYRKRLNPNPLFDAQFYDERRPSAEVIPGQSQLEHYLLVGAQRGLDPSPYFSSQGYLDKNSDVRSAGMNPLTHFFQYGQFENREWIGKSQVLKSAAEAFTTHGRQPLLYTLSVLAPNPWGRNYGTHKFITKIESAEAYATERSGVLYSEEPEKIVLAAPDNVGSNPRHLPADTLLAPRPYVARFKQAGVIGGGRFILTNDGHVLHDEIFSDPTKEYGVKSLFLKRVWQDQVCLHFEKRNVNEIKAGILICSEHDSNYFHWLIESLPKLFLAERADIPADIPLLIPKGLHPNLMDALKAVNVKKRPLIQLEKGSLYRVQDLYYPSDLCRINDRYAGKISTKDCIIPRSWTRQTAKAILEAYHPAEGRRRKLYLTRRGAGYRKLVNEVELEGLFFDAGFEIVDLEGASLSTQVRFFQSADTVVAPSGATCTNQIFCRPGTRFFIISGDHPSSNFYVFNQLGSHADLKTRFLLGASAHHIRESAAVHDDFRVDPKWLMEQVTAGDVAARE